MLTILEGSTFCVSDEIGDVEEGAEGLFADDTRMLSRCRLLVDGTSPLLLTSKAVEYFHAAHYLRNAPTARLPVDSLSIARERYIGQGLVERIAVRNESMEPRLFDVEIEFASDFADILLVKAHDFGFGDPANAAPLPAERGPRRAGPATLRVSGDDDGLATTISFSQDATFTGAGARFSLRLDPHEKWELAFEVTFGAGAQRGGSVGPAFRFGTELEHVREALGAWKLRVPRLRTSATDLQRSYERSIADLASLRLKGIEGIGELPAAGMPWFMTLFGRDTLVTSLQTLLFGPELAAGALRSLAALQAEADDPSIDAEPGKILHELRRGKAAKTWFPIYYGTADATPLFLILLSEVWRWTGDDALARELKEPALRALAWMSDYGDRDGDGFVEYERRTPRGLENQSWKDSGDSQRFHDGSPARTPIAPVEVQGYVYDARRRMAELARAVWGDPALAERLDASADDLRRRFDEAFWIEERSTYALALDRDKRRVDSLCSNIGHLLWSGIVPEAKRAAVASSLSGDALWSGWGIRTMGVGEGAFNPLSYHNGTVWPHDTAIAAWGLARAGFWDLSHMLCRSLIEAAGSFDYSLPEVFAGFSRSETAFPVAYPTAARPQAWAAGAPVLCLRLLLGLRADTRAGRLVSDAPAPAWLGELKLDGVRALGKTWHVEIANGHIEVEETP